MSPYSLTSCWVMGMSSLALDASDQPASAMGYHKGELIVFFYPLSTNSQLAI